jgi:hypothetical protein
VNEPLPNQTEERADFSIEKYGERTAEKEECEEQLLAEYGAMLAFYLASVTLLTRVAVDQDRLPRKFGALDLALLAVATHKLSRIVARDRITGVLRAPFVSYIRSAGARLRDTARHRQFDFVSVLHGAMVRDSARLRTRVCAARHAVVRCNFCQRCSVGFPFSRLPQDEGRKIGTPSPGASRPLVSEMMPVGYHDWKFLDFARNDKSGAD